MATIDDLLLKNKGKIKTQIIKKESEMKKEEVQQHNYFNYRPWNFMDEMDRQNAIEEEQKKVLSAPAQIENKTTPNLPQTGNKVATETGNKVVTKRKQTGNNSHTIPTQPPHNPHTTTTQSSHNPHTSLHTIPTQPPHKNISFEMLSGNSKKIVSYLYNQCKINRKCEVLVSSESIVASTNIAIGSVSTTLKRLKESSYIELLQTKSGAGAWRLIRLNDSIYKEILASELPHNPHTIPTQPPHNHHTIATQLPHNCHTSPHTNSPVVVSSYITTTTNTNSVDNLPLDWQAINYEPVRGIGFSEATILQLYAAKRTTAQVVQESIDNFALTLQHNLQAYKSPLGALISVLNKGGVWMRNEALKATAEPLISSAKPPAETKEEAFDRAEAERKFDNAYFAWFSALSNEEIKQLFPDYNENSDKNQKYYFFQCEAYSRAKDVFRKTKWLEIHDEVLGENK